MAHEHFIGKEMAYVPLKYNVFFAKGILKTTY